MYIFVLMEAHYDSTKYMIHFFMYRCKKNISGIIWFNKLWWT